jgi:hypothetical protein
MKLNTIATTSTKLVPSNVNIFEDQTHQIWGIAVHIDIEVRYVLALCQIDAVVLRYCVFARGICRITIVISPVVSSCGN